MHADKPHISLAAYTLVFAALMILLVVTVAAARVHWGTAALGVAVALSIAVVKAVLVVFYFMHVKLASRLTKTFVVAGLFWLGLMVVLMIADYMSRGWLPSSSGWTHSPPIPDPLPNVITGPSEPAHP